MIKKKKQEIKQGMKSARERVTSQIFNDQREREWERAKGSGRERERARGSEWEREDVSLNI